jgi:hypothetical protein
MPNTHLLMRVYSLECVTEGVYEAVRQHCVQAGSINTGQAHKQAGIQPSLRSKVRMHSVACCLNMHTRRNVPYCCAALHGNKVVLT